MIALSRSATEPSALRDHPPAPMPPGSEPDARRRHRRAEQLGDDIARLGAHLDAALYRQLVMIREFDGIEGWHIDGSKSCAQWLSWRTGLAPGAARERVRVARALEPLPRLSDALRRGRLSYPAARALTRVATPENEAELVEVARHTSAAQLEKLVRSWRALDRASGAEGERARHEQRGLSLAPDPDGSWDMRARLDPEVGAEADRLIALAEDILRKRGVLDPDATASQRRADAFALLFEAAHGGLEAMAAEVAEGVEGVEVAGVADGASAAEVAERARAGDEGNAGVVRVVADGLRDVEAPRSGRPSRAPVSSRADSSGSSAASPSIRGLRPSAGWGIRSMRTGPSSRLARCRRRSR